jgi:PAS domain-containing protein
MAIVIPQSSVSPQGEELTRRLLLDEVDLDDQFDVEDGSDDNYYKPQSSHSSDVERLRLLETVVVNANDVILITRAEPIDGPQGPCVVYGNDAFTRMTGYSPEDTMGKTPRLLQGPETCR